MRTPEPRAALVIAALGLGAGLAFATPTLPLPLRAVAALMLAFVLPGAALTVGLLPRVPLLRSERLATTLGGSMSATIGGAFLLHALPSGLSAGSWAALLGGIAVAGGLVGWMRTVRRPAPGAMTAPTTTGPWPPAPSAVVPSEGLVSPWTVAVLAAAGVLVALSLVIARSGVALGPTAAFTELWLLPLDGGAAVRVGVANHEGAPETYRLVVTLDGRPLGKPAEVPLADGGAMDAIIELPDGVGTRTVEARLWRSDQPRTGAPDRSVRVVVTRDTVATP